MNYIDILTKLKQSGFEAFLVGGAVRDIFLKVPSDDFDIVTSASPDQIIELFKDYHIDIVGKSFQVVIVNNIQIATYRIDIYSGLDDKNVEIKRAKTVEEDLSRRDFTFNSMAYDPFTNKLIDLFGGLTDLTNKVVKFVGDPEKRIYEDPNRIIRACRMLCMLNGTFNKNTMNYLQKMSYYIKDYIYPERIRIEILKAMKYKRPSIFFKALHDIGALKYILPSLEECYNHEHGKYHIEDVFEHSMLCGDLISVKFPILRLAGYLHDIGKPQKYLENLGNNFVGHDKLGSDLAKAELLKLKFSNNEINFITNIIGLHMHTFQSGKSIRRLFVKLNKCSIDIKELLRLKIADRNSNLAKEKMSYSEKRELMTKIKIEINKKSPNKYSDLNINGNDIMRILNLQQGPIIGEILKYLFDIVVDNPELNSFELLENIVKNYFNERNNNEINFQQTDSN